MTDISKKNSGELVQGTVYLDITDDILVTVNWFSDTRTITSWEIVRMTISLPVDWGGGIFYDAPFTPTARALVSFIKDKSKDYIERKCSRDMKRLYGPTSAERPTDPDELRDWMWKQALPIVLRP